VAVTEPAKRPSRSRTKDRLAPYRAKRHFDRTPEPSGSTPPEPGQRFVVQRHRARRLHYDFRLEVDGVLVSWAVPKGPTLDPKARRMAVHVEDHPVEYYDFEGVIPAGEYGGGDVIVWDWGTWSVDDGVDLVAAVRDGDVHVDLHGEKLKGRFVLVRRDDKPAGKEQWLLLHKNDEAAVAGWDPEEHGLSVKSGRTNDEVAADPDYEWRGDAPAESAAVPVGSADHTAPATTEELDALAAIGREGLWAFQGRELKVTNLDKILYPGRGREADITKRELLAYHAAVAPAMLPYLAGRPVNLHRYPEGATKKGFWHKEHPKHAPDWVARWHYDDADPDETQWYSVIDSAPALVWAANYGGAVEPVEHRADRPAVGSELRVVELVPRDRHRDGRAWRRTRAEGRDERLVDRVLRVVEAGETTALGLLPLPADELGHRVADQPGEPLHPCTGVIERVAGSDRDPDLDPPPA
jgi:bifunctional non-homologous end joining protein LigD